MRSLPTNLATELEADQHGDLTTVVEIGLSTPIYRTVNPGGITFDSKTYVYDAYEFGQIGATVIQSSPTIDLSLQNIRHPTTEATRPWSTVLAGTESVNGIAVTVRILMIAELADTTAQIEEENWTVNGPPRLSGDRLVLQLGPPMDTGRLTLPEPMLRSPRCRAEYKDGFCNSTSPLLTCPGKSLGECSKRHSPQKVRISQMPFNPQRIRRTG